VTSLPSVAEFGQLTYRERSAAYATARAAVVHLAGGHRAAARAAAEAAECCAVHVDARDQLDLIDPATRDARALLARLGADPDAAAHRAVLTAALRPRRHLHVAA